MSVIRGTGRFYMSTGEATVDPRFSWALTGTPPTKATVEAYKKAINEFNNNGNK